jgi:cation transport protein ChaC
MNDAGPPNQIRHPTSPRPADDAPALALPPGDLWVFGYGSLMWNPGFVHLEAVPAHIHGYHRSLCVWSWVHRGTREAPGLVLGLDGGGSCVGMAYRVAPAHRQRTVEYLYAREMVTRVYFPVLRTVRLAHRGAVRALTFAVDREHRQYAGKLSARVAADTVLRAEGKSGANTEYLANTLAHLRELGIHCPLLESVQRAVSHRTP